MENKRNRLQELKGSDYKIVDEQPDIKGWPIYDDQHQKLGEVEDLLFDQESRKVRYIIADLDDNELDMDAREVLIPIGIAELHETEDEVILPGVTATQLSALPEYNDDRDVTDADENAIFAGFPGESSATYDTASGLNTDRYNHSHFDDQKMYRNRNKQTDRIAEGNESNLFRVDVEPGGDIDSDRNMKRDVENGLGR